MCLSLTTACRSGDDDTATPDDRDDTTAETGFIRPVRSGPLPPGFSRTPVDGLGGNPTGMRILDDGRILVIEHEGDGRDGDTWLGEVTVVDGGVPLPEPMLSIPVAAGGEQLGIQDVVMHPSEPLLYVTYTHPDPVPHNRLARFRVSDDGVAGDEELLVALPPIGDGETHFGGALAFGSDGKLFWAVGDHQTPSTAQRMDSLFGKLLRLDDDGSIPDDNPFLDRTEGNNRAIYALGLRNPWRMAHDGVSGAIHLHDVGASTWEEINVVEPGANYGWPVIEGPANSGHFTDPLLVFHHEVGAPSGCAVVGGDFYRPATAMFPEEYVGDYFFGEYCHSWISRIDSETGALVRFSDEERVPAAVRCDCGQLIDVRVAPDGALWQLHSRRVEGGAETRLYRVTHSGDGTPTTDQFSVDGSATEDTEGAPVVTIDSPAIGATYEGGQTIEFSASAVDPDGSELPATAFSWTVEFLHGDDAHPVIAGMTGVASGSFRVPVIRDNATDVRYRIHMTVTDSDGVSTHASRDVLPAVTTVTLRTEPPGLGLFVDGRHAAAPVEFDSVVGVARVIGAPVRQDLDGVTYVFTGWSGGGSVTDRLFPGPEPTTLTASYRVATGPPATEAGADGFVWFTGVPGDRAQAALPPIDSVDLRLRIALDDWTPDRFTGLVASRHSSLRASVRRDGRLAFRVVTGSDDTAFNAVSTEAPVVDDGEPLWLRFTYDPAAGDVRFFASASDVSDGTEVDDWQQIGDALESGTAGPLAQPGGLVVGTGNFFTARATQPTMVGRLHGIALLDGDTVVTAVDFSTVADMTSIGPDHSGWGDWWLEGQLWEYVEAR